MALPYLPSADIIPTFNLLEAYAISAYHTVGPAVITAIETYVRYFRRQWLENTSIPIQVWNVHNRLQYTTINAVEGTHWAFLLHFGVHSSLEQTFIPKVRQYRDQQIAKLHQAYAGQRVVRRNSTVSF